MSLDLLAVSTQARAMSGALHDELRSLPQRVEQARALLAAAAEKWRFWHDLIEEQSQAIAWLTAQPLEPLTATYDLPPCPAAYACAAVDGSHLDVDRHGIVACWLINIGTALVRYGPDAAYQASSRPWLGYRDEELYLRDAASGREYAIEGPLLAAQRDVEEGRALAALAGALPTDRPRLALQDGTLIRWTLAAQDEVVRNYFLQRYLDALTTLQTQQCPVAGYLSRPRAREVVGLVRLLLARSDERDGQRGRRDDPLRGLTDALLFEHLDEGQRSARWVSTSRINSQLYGPHRIQFFYLRVGRELARIEYPAWVAELGAIDTVHALVYDQCQRGRGYPNLLARAHEQAVIHSAERRRFETLIEQHLARAELPARRSAKASAKLYPGA
ncbi:DNA double-strand break repair nuclease NurA [Kallotenue papyrolyticum]|uniref:DNA double-strand break repair nuclease NurA n=1 Tax=Kallotenue papyrolyticum TaxID=1325125 RepID=UPI0004785CBC|nr:DNA double-strand break repair nuclease NurA [Kallotenue papyrolyticum]